MRIKTAANVIDSHLACVINKDFMEKKSGNAKTALARPIYRKDNREKSKAIDQSVFKMLFPKFMKDFYVIVYPISQITYFPNLFQLIESQLV